MQSLLGEEVTSKNGVCSLRIGVNKESIKCNAHLIDSARVRKLFLLSVYTFSVHTECAEERQNILERVATCIAAKCDRLYAESCV